MTRQELSDLFGGNYLRQISAAVTEAEKEMPALQNKRRLGSWFTGNFSREEIKFICRFMPISVLEAELVGENYVDHGDIQKIKREHGEYDYYIKGTKKFMKRYKRESKCRCECCTTCSYLIGKTIATQPDYFHPYCSFYDKFIFNMKTIKWGTEKKPDIFHDKCPTYSRAQKPKLFKRKGY